MKSQTEKSQENQRRAIASDAIQQQVGIDAAFQFIDNREETAQLRQLQAAVDNSLQVKSLAKLQAMVDNSPRFIAQRQVSSEDEELLQGQFVSESTAQLTQQPITKPNSTGLPENLKSGIENLSGLSIDNVKVHYNSPQPAQLNAHAYAQGTNIYLAPGQEQHLPHEAWHVMQQAQGRVKPTMQMKDGVAINDDQGLENDADVMGAKAITQYKYNTTLNQLRINDKFLQNKEKQFNNTEKIVQCELSQEDFDVIERTVNALKKNYPLDEYFYVGLGKSPTPIIAYLEAEGEAGIVNMPLSKFTHAYNDASKSSPLFSGKLNKSQLAELQRHFDSFIPTKTELNGRKLLLIDFITSGRSLISTQKHIENYLTKKYGPKGFWCCKTPGEVPPELVPLALHQEEANTDFVDAENIAKLALDEGQTQTIGDTEKFKPRAQYPNDFRVEQGHKSAEIVESEEYALLVEEFREKQDSGDNVLVDLVS